MKKNICSVNLFERKSILKEKKTPWYLSCLNTPSRKEFSKPSKDVLVLGTCQVNYWKNITTRSRQMYLNWKDCFSVKNTCWNNLLMHHILKKLITNTNILKLSNNIWKSWNHYRWKYFLKTAFRDSWKFSGRDCRLVNTILNEKAESDFFFFLP